MKQIKYTSIGSTVWFAIFVLDYVIELFQINSSSKIVTFMGLKITTVMTKQKIDTVLSMTWKALIIYLIFIIIWIFAVTLISKNRKQKSRSNVC
ncbi:hypothetical protein DSM07_08050 [Oenococcus sp. UCMA 16435]|nr:hypothetical protein DSM07_08050 [Oenococcus sp. UCMA 16435]MDI4585178.1 hypothetical protein [Oenococcus sp. UCMA 14587]